MTDRLYYTDCYVTRFSAQVTGIAGDRRRVYLDRSAFYPTSGGQQFDLGTLAGIAVSEVVDEDDRVAHVLEAPLPDDAAEVEGVIDWTRRFDRMQQHTGQHLLSAVLEELFGAATVSVHMGDTSSTVDVKAANLSMDQLAQAEDRCARIVAEARPVAISFEEAGTDLGLRKASQRSGTLRIVNIEGVDRSACGGTHLRSTAEIGPIILRRTEKIRDTVRIEFLCGHRALARTREDSLILATLGKSFASQAEKLPALADSLLERNKTLEKQVQKLTGELAQREGRELYLATSPAPDGIRYYIQRGPIDDAVRAKAQAYVAGEKAVFLAICEQPVSILLAASPDSGIHAGNRVKTAVTAAGGRGGGSQTLGQGSAQGLQSLLTALALPTDS